MDEGKGNKYLRTACGLKQLIEWDSHGGTSVQGVPFPFRPFFYKTDGFFVAFVAKRFFHPYINRFTFGIYFKGYFYGGRSGAGFIPVFFRHYQVITEIGVIIFPTIGGNRFFQSYIIVIGPAGGIGPLVIDHQGIEASAVIL